MTVLHAIGVLGSSTQYLEVTIRYSSNHSNTKLHACSMHDLFSEIHACYMKHASMLTLQHACLGDTCKVACNMLGTCAIF